MMGEEILVYDLDRDRWHDLTSHGRGLASKALVVDATGTRIVTGDAEGTVRVGPTTGEEPHLLLGHESGVAAVAVSPDGKWIASGDEDGTIRLWPMPQGPPLHTLPYEELCARLRAMTNLRFVKDEVSELGYRLVANEFPGWTAATF